MSFLLPGSQQQFLQNTDIPIPLPKATVHRLGLNNMGPVEIQNTVFVYSVSPQANINDIVYFFSFCGIVRKVVMGNAKSLGIDSDNNTSQNTTTKDAKLISSTPQTIRTSRDSIGDDSENRTPILSTSIDDWENVMNLGDMNHLQENNNVDFDIEGLEFPSGDITSNTTVPIQNSELQNRITSKSPTPTKKLLDIDSIIGIGNETSGTPPGSPGGNIISRLWSTTIGSPSTNQNISITGNNCFAVVTFDTQSAYQTALLLNDAIIEGQSIRVISYKSMLPSTMQSAIPRLDLSFLPSDRSAISVVQGLLQKGYFTSEKALDSIKNNAKNLDQHLHIGESVNRSIGTARRWNQEIESRATRLGEKSLESITKTRDYVDNNLRKLDEKLKISNKASTAKSGLLTAGVQAKEKITKVNTKVENRVRNTSEHIRNKVSDLKVDEKIRSANESVQNGFMMGWQFLKSTITTAFQPEDEIRNQNSISNPHRRTQSMEYDIMSDFTQDSTSRHQFNNRILESEKVEEDFVFVTNSKSTPEEEPIKKEENTLGLEFF